MARFLIVCVYAIIVIIRYAYARITCFLEPIMIMHLIGH